MIFKEMNRIQCKSYLVACENTKKAIIIDPVKKFIDRYLALLAYYDLTLEFVIDTHTHADHRSACSDLRGLLGCEIIRHQLAPQPNTDVSVDDGDSINVGRLEFKVLYTPGHSEDSISLYIDGRVLTGDVLLIGGTGRSDFAGGNSDAQYNSIIQKLFSLPDDTLVYPAHDYRGHSSSTIGHEKQHNPRIANRTQEEYKEIMANLNLDLPKKIQEVLITNITEDEDNEIALPSLTALHQVRRIDADQLAEMLINDLGLVVVDVRTVHEFHGLLGHIKNSIHIPLQQLAERSGELEKYRNQKIILVCRAGVRSVTGAAILTGMGFSQVCDLEGGMVVWNKKNHPVDDV